MKVNNSKDVLGPNTIVALYVRVSTSRQEKEKTIDSQIDELKKHCDDKKYKIFDIYQDNGYSGNVFERPALDRLRDDARLKRFEAVICSAPDRLARNAIYLAIVKWELERLNIPIIFLTNPKVATSPGEKLLEHVQVGIAEYESTIIKDRTRRGKMSKAKRGVVITSQAPYGFRYIRKDEKSAVHQKLIVDRQEFETVRLMIKWFVTERLSYRGIARRLQEMGIMTKKGKAKWSKSTIKGILSNSIYTGKWYYNKRKREPSSTAKGYRRTVNNLLRLRNKRDWIRIDISIPDDLRIDDKLFKEIEGIRIERRKFYRKHPKHKYLLSGLLFCAACQNRYLSTPFHGVPYYRCSSRTSAQSIECNSKSVKAEKIDEIILRSSVELLTKSQWLYQYIRNIKININHKVEELTRKNKQLNSALVEIQKKRERVVELWEKRAIDERTLAMRLEKHTCDERRIQGEKTEVQRKISECHSLPEDFMLSEHFIDTCLKKVKQKLRDAKFEVKKHLLHLLIKKVILGKDEVIIRGYLPVSWGKDSSLSFITSL
jgi:site-specific DNA recombinase